MKININSEFGTLKSALLHLGDNLGDPEGSKTKLSKRDQDYIRKYLPYHPESSQTPYEPDLLREELSRFRELLSSCGVELHFPETIPGAMMQFFTRDPSFAIGKTLFVPKQMSIDYRDRELEGLAKIKAQCQHAILTEMIEGGDVIVHGASVFVGVGRHTNYAAVSELEAYTSEQVFSCIPLESGPEVLHLDCRIMPFSEEGIVLREDGLTDDAIRTIKNRFKDIIMVTTPDLGLATNFFMLAPDHAVMDPRNQFLGDQFEERDIKVTYQDFGQITNFWGGFRCTVCPIEREPIVTDT